MFERELNHLEKIQDKYHLSHFGFLRNITTISVGLLGLLVSLKPEVITLFIGKIAFMITIICLTIGIVMSVISQYYEVYNRKEEKRLVTDNLSNKLDGKSTKKMTVIPKPKLFSLSEKLTYFFLGISLISLVSYVFLIEFFS